jgi:hypothetical protein
MSRCRTESKKKLMSIDEFRDFVNSQRDPRLNEILYPYCTLDKAKDLIGRNEPDQFNVKVGKVVAALLTLAMLDMQEMLLIPFLAASPAEHGGLPEVPPVRREPDRVPGAVRPARRHDVAALALLHPVLPQHLSHR